MSGRDVQEADPLRSASCMLNSLTKLRNAIDQSHRFPSLFPRRFAFEHQGLQIVQVDEDDADDNGNSASYRYKRNRLPIQNSAKTKGD